MSLKVKVGQKIRHNSGPEYTVRMVGTGLDPDLAIENKRGDVFIIDWTKHKYYTVVDNFFKVGKTYKFKERNGFQRTDTWKILAVHEVDRPVPGNEKRKAVAKMTTEGGFQDIQTLSQDDFERMIEA